MTTSANKLRAIVYDFRQPYRGVAMDAVADSGWHSSVYDDPMEALVGLGAGTDALIIPYERTRLRPFYRVDSPAGYLLSLAISFSVPVAVLADQQTPEINAKLTEGTRLNTVVPTGEGTSVDSTHRTIEPRAYNYLRSCLGGWLETVRQLQG